MRYVEIGPGHLELVTGEPLALGPGDCRIAVQACGICGTDLHMMHDMVLPRGTSYPLRPGHEVAGTIVEVGSEVSGFTVGDQVLAHPLDPCGGCRPCTTGREQRCLEARVLGITAPGGLGDELVWPARRLVPATGLASEHAALLPDAVSTAYHALGVARLDPGATVAVIGAGGVGMHVVQLLRAIDPTAVVAAVVRNDIAAERVRALGAHVIRGLSGANRTVRGAVGRCDAVLDFSGADEACAEGVRMLVRGGRLVLGSIVDKPLNIGTTTTGIVTAETEVLGSYSSNIDDLRAVTELARSGALDLSESTSMRIPLDEVRKAFDILENRPPGLIRLVVEP